MDDPQLRKRLERMLKVSSEFKLLNVYANGAAAMVHLPKQAPGLLLADLKLPGMRGAAIVAQTRATLPTVPIVVCAADEDVPAILQAIRAGANGYVSHDADDEAILAELHAVRLGGATLTPAVAEAILNLQTSRRFHSPVRGEGLTPRELEILNPIALGFGYAEIAERLKIDVAEVRAHIAQVYRKLVSANTRPMAETPAPTRKLRLI